MQEEQQNIHPNQGTPELADIIRENIHFRMDQSNKRTLFKESMLKISLDKDFEHLFQNHCQGKTQVNSQQQINAKNSIVQVSEQIKQICHWLEQKDDYHGIAYLPFNSLSKLMHIIHQKIEGTAIIVTQYPTYWIHKMDQIGRLNKLKWALLSAHQQPEQKVKVLELYELKKIKLLFITPNLFMVQQYHQFQCDLLLMNDLHLYHGQNTLISKIINKTNPSRILSLYHSLMQDNYLEFKTSAIVEVNKPKSQNHNMIVLKSNLDDKFKLMMSYLGKHEYQKVLLIVNKRQQAYSLNKKLLMQSKTSINLFDQLTQQELNCYQTGEVLKRIDKDREEQKIFSILQKINNSQITISKYTDFLRFCSFNLVIFYTFTDAVKFVQSSFNVKERLLLFADQDYHNHRNYITSDLITHDDLQKIVMKMIEKPIKKDQKNKKRYYSDHVDQKIFNNYTVSKDYAEKNQEKVIKMNMFCRKYQISAKLFAKILQSLEKNGIVETNYRTVCEIQIQNDYLQRMKRQFPLIQQIRKRVNLLNVSTCLQKTVRTILDQFKKEGIKYKVSEEALQIKIIKDYQEIDWEQVKKTVNQQVVSQVLSLDKSFEVFKDCAYSSIELTKREKALQKKQLLINFLSKEQTLKESLNILMESFHRSNLLTSEIQEWIRHTQQVTINEHELVLLLQGVDKGRVSKFKDDPIYGRYRRLKYQQIMEAVNKIYSHKKIKVQ